MLEVSGMRSMRERLVIMVLVKKIGMMNLKEKRESPSKRNVRNKA